MGVAFGGDSGGWAEPILVQAQGDVYLAVGSERGLWGFGLAPKQRHLIMADSHPRVVLYNLINLALLKSSSSLAEYRRLRRTKRLADWQSAVRLGAKDLARFAYADPRVFAFWTERQDLFGDLEQEMFTKGNYLVDEAAFARVSTAAKEGRVQVVHAAYGDGEAFRLLIEDLRVRKLSLGVLDFSNAWMFDQKVNNAMLREVADVTLLNSVYLITDGQSGDWTYKALFFGGFGMRVHGILSTIWRPTPGSFLGPFPMKSKACDLSLGTRDNT